MIITPSTLYRFLIVRFLGFLALAVLLASVAVSMIEYPYFRAFALGGIVCAPAMILVGEWLEWRRWRVPSRVIPVAVLSARRKREWFAERR